MGLRPDLAFIADQRPRHESDRSSRVGAHLGSLVRAATSAHPWIATWTSWLLGTKVYVSRMSDTWLRTHAGDWDKHGRH
jgi:hypothetical protein